MIKKNKKLLGIPHLFLYWINSLPCQILKSMFSLSMTGSCQQLLIGFYGPVLRYFILLVIPVGMIASFPTRVLVDPADNWVLLVLLVVAAAFLFIANLFWRWSVKRYMSIG